MTECVYCKGFWTCMDSAEGYRKAQELYPGNIAQAGEKRAEYMQARFCDCKKFQEA